MSKWKEFLNKKESYNINRDASVSEENEKKVLDSLVNHITISRMSFQDFVKKHPEILRTLPLFSSFAKTRNPMETIGNLIKAWLKNPNLHEWSKQSFSVGDKVILAKPHDDLYKHYGINVGNKGTIYGIQKDRIYVDWEGKKNTMIPSFADELIKSDNEFSEDTKMTSFVVGDKVSDHINPRKIGIVVNSGNSSVSIKWADGKMSTTYPNNLKLVSKTHSFKNGNKVQDVNGMTGEITNANPMSNMDIGASFPVVSVKWDNGKSSSADATKLKLIESYANEPVHPPISGNPKTQIISTQKAFSMLSNIGRILLKQDKVVESIDGKWYIQRRPGGGCEITPKKQ